MANVRADLRDDKTSRSELTSKYISTPSESSLADVEMGSDERSNAEMDQMLEEFEAAQRKRDRATVGGETCVVPFENGHNNAPFPQSGNHTPRQDDVEEIEQGALPPRERDLEQRVRHSVKTHCRIHANPRARRNSEAPLHGKTSTERTGPSPLQRTSRQRTPRNAPQLMKSAPSRVPLNRALRGGLDGQATERAPPAWNRCCTGKCVE